MQTAVSRIRLRSFFLQRCIPAFHKGIRMQVKFKPPFPELEFVHFLLQQCIPAFHKGIRMQVKFKPPFLELQFVHFFYNDVSLPLIKELGCK